MAESGRKAGNNRDFFLGVPLTLEETTQEVVGITARLYQEWPQGYDQGF